MFEELCDGRERFAGRYSIFRMVVPGLVRGVYRYGGMQCFNDGGKVGLCYLHVRSFFWLCGSAEQQLYGAVGRKRAIRNLYSAQSNDKRDDHTDSERVTAERGVLILTSNFRPRGDEQHAYHHYDEDGSAAAKCDADRNMAGSAGRGGDVWGAAARMATYDDRDRRDRDQHARLRWR